MPNKVSVSRLQDTFDQLPDQQAAYLKAADIMGAISAEIIRSRAKMGMSPEDFAAYLGVSLETEKRYESGAFDFSIKALCHLCLQLGFDLNISLVAHENKSDDRGGGMNKYWLLIPSIIQQQNNNLYAVPIDQIMYQKVCFLLELSGFPMGFFFDYHESYGAFSKEADEARVDLIKANIIYERKYGEFVDVRVNPEFQLNKEIFSEEELITADRVSDLLCRMHSIEQAVEDSVVLLAYDHLRWKQDSVSEEEILNTVIKVLPYYQDKKNHIIIAIQSLAMLGWIQTDPHRGVLEYAEEDIY